MNRIQQSFLSTLQIQERYFDTAKTTDAAAQTTETGETKQLSFQDVFSQKVQEASQEEELRFSKHASSRLADRNIELTGSQLDRLAEGTRRAGTKGIKDSLVMVDDLAFIVNVPNHTVVTALDQTQADEKIFTNIDGAVIA